MIVIDIDTGIQDFPDFSRNQQLAGAQIYLGAVDLDPQVPGNQIQAYVVQEDGTQVAVPQPILTSSGGVPTYNGAPVKIAVAQSSYSIKVLNSLGSQIYYRPNLFVGLSALNSTFNLEDYTALRAYEGEFTTVYITGVLASAMPQGISGVFQYDETDVTSADNGGTIIVGTDGRRWKRVFNGDIHVSWFGATGDGVTDDSVAVLAAINFAQTEGPWTFPKGCRVVFDNGTYILSQSYTYNPQLVSLVGNHTTLDFSALVSGTAIWLRGEGTAGESFVGNRYKIAIENIKLVGNTNITLVDVYSDSGTQDSRGISMRNVFFNEFLIGINLAQNGWSLGLDNYVFLTSTSSGIHINEVEDNAGAGIVNFGECNTFARGMHTGGGTAYKSRNFNSDAHFSRVSFDCEIAIDIARGAKVSVDQFHIESGFDTADLFQVDGDAAGFAQTTLNMTNGTLQIIGSSRTFDFFACAKNFSVGGGGINIDGMTIVGGTGGFNWINKSLIGGTGPAKVRNYTYQFQPPAITLSDAMNEISNGGFETGALGDWDAFDPAFPPTVTTTSPRTGTYCVEMVPVGGAIVGITKTVACKPMQKAFFGMFYKLESVVNGGAAFKEFFVRYTVYAQNGVALKSEEQYFDGTVPYTYFSFNTLSTAPLPKGADYITIDIVMYQAASGTARVDDVVLNIIE